MRILYPFSAIVGQEEMKTALLLASVDPGIGGVLIQGHKGTAKSTAARALVSLLPSIRKVKGCAFNCPPDNPDRMHDECRERFLRKQTLPAEVSPVSFVELPLSATEDRLVGTLHIEHALKTGERRFDPGILASANRGILYIDEVNLLEDHLVDMILDAAASGYTIVEREGISLIHPSHFILIGTMNPEEGELRPQFIDRFGLSVMIKGIENKQQRIEIVKRRMAYETSPVTFIKDWANEEKLLTEQIKKAQDQLYKIKVPDDVWDLAASICIKAKVRGHRADITLIKSATALAALIEKHTVTEKEIKEVLPYILLHRMESVQLESPEKIHEKVQSLINSIDTTHGAQQNVELLSTDAKNNINSNPEEEGDERSDIEKMQVPGAGAVGSLLFTFLKKKIRKKHSGPGI